MFTKWFSGHPNFTGTRSPGHLVRNKYATSRWSYRRGSPCTFSVIVCFCDGSLCQALEVATQSNIVSSSSSQVLYSGLQHNFSLGMHPYLDDKDNLWGTRLMTRLGFGALWLMERIASVLKLKLPDDQGRCLLCHSGASEDGVHFVLQCPFLAQQRSHFHLALESALCQAGVAGRFLLDEFRQAAPETALTHIAGCRRYLPPRPGLNADELRSHIEQSAKALWIFDNVVEEFSGSLLARPCSNFGLCQCSRRSARA